MESAKETTPKILDIKLGKFGVDIGNVDNTLKELHVLISYEVPDNFKEIAVFDHLPKTLEVKEAIDKYLNTEKANGRLSEYSYFGEKLKKEIGVKLKAIYDALHPKPEAIPPAIPIFPTQSVKTVVVEDNIVPIDELTVERMAEVARILKNKYHCKTLEAANLSNEYMLVWYDGYFQKNREGVLRADIKKMLGDSFSLHWFNTVINHIKAMEVPIKWTEFKQKPETVNLKNGILDYSGECKVYDYDCGDGVVFIERKSPDDFNDYNFDYKLPIAFNPKADCPTINKVLDEILIDRDDTDVSDVKRYRKVAILNDYLGSLLMSNIEVKEVPTLLGKPNCGKSTLLNLCRQFAGDENVCSVSVQDLSGQFTGASIDGALANIVDEITYVNAKTIDKFKGMVAGSPTEIERKGKDRYTIYPKAKMLMAGNKTFGMKIDVKSDFMSRIVCVECNNVFGETAGKNKCRNSKIKDKKYSDEELSGLLNRAIGGLIRLLKYGRYDHESAEDYELWLKYETTVNEAESFIEQKLEYTTNPDSTLEKEEVYFEYKNWYKETNQPIEDMLSQKEFSHAVLIYFGEDRIKTIYLDDREESEAKDKRIRKPYWRYLTYKTQIGYRPLFTTT